MFSSKIVIISDKIGRDELKENKAIGGPPGKILDECLRNNNLTRSSIYCTTIAKQFGEDPNESCLEKLFSDLNQLDCKAIVLLGEKCLKLICSRERINKWRGSVIEIPELLDKFIIPTYHPSVCIPLKYGGEGRYLDKLLIQWDIAKAARIAKNGFHRSQRELIITPTFTDVMQWLERVRQAGLAGKTIDFDIELMNMEVSCISITDDYQKVMSIPFIDDRGLYFSPDQDCEIWLAIANILENHQIKKRGQYLIFDTHFLLRRYGIKTHNIDDTMIAQKIIMPDYPVGLDFITSIYTDKEYYKDEGKKYFSGGNWPRLWQYNATDSSICGEAFPQQLANLEHQHNIETYRRQVRMVEPLCYAMERGIRVDVAGMQAEFTKAEAHIEQLRKELTEICGYELNPNSPKQLINHFYINKKIPPYKKGGKVTTDEKALVRIARKGHPEAAKILEIRRAVKRKSTYLNTDKIDLDGRMRCAYNPVGTRYSRISSSESIFGTGNNMQNQPHEILKFFLADEGYIYYGFDLSQAENRIVAYVGQIPQMMEAFELGLDVHSLTGSLISGLSVEEVRRQDDNNICCPIGGGDKTWRFFGKRCFVGDTEVLTPFGWIRIDKLDYKNIPIMQWNKENRECSFTYIKNLTVSICDSLFELSGQNCHICGSDNHKIPLYRKDSNKFKTCELSKIQKDNHYGVPLTGFLNNEYSWLNPFETMLLVAFQADGSFNGNSYRFKFTKERKIKRIEMILENLQIKYTKTIINDGSTCFYFTGPNWLTKQFDSKLLLLGKHELKIFIQEVTKWDGYEAKNIREYFTTNNNNAIWVQTIAHLVGCAATVVRRKPTNGVSKKDLFIVMLNERNQNSILVSQTLNKKQRGDIVFGPEVESGFILIKSKGKISVTGNSNHGLNYDLGYKTFALYLEIPESDARFIVDRYHLSYPGVRNNYHNFVKQKLSENRTITNLMGRNTVFLEEWGDDLFKEAYACIPQGTVGDVINERGVEYVYYNQERFNHVEFLIQVHDSIGIQIPISAGLSYHAACITDIKRSLEQPLILPNGNQLIIPVDVVAGLDMYKGHCKKVKATNEESTLQELTLICDQLVKEQHERESR